MSKWRKKPVVIEAIQYDGGSKSLTEVAKFLRNDFIDSGSNGEVYIATLEGEITASVGDYIIRGIAGEHYPCKPDIFVKTYEKVEDDRFPTPHFG